MSDLPLWRRVLSWVLGFGLVGLAAYGVYRSTHNRTGSVAVVAVQAMFAVYWIWGRKADGSGRK